MARIWVMIFLWVVSGAAAAQPVEPPRGSELRAELLDTVRPLVEYDLGAPVEFMVWEMSVDGDLAFARMRAQRPGGGVIDMETTPMVARRHVPMDLIDGPRLEVFFARTEGHWYVYEYVIGSTDAWWWGFQCETFGTLLIENHGC